jgi:catalase
MKKSAPRSGTARSAKPIASSAAVGTTSSGPSHPPVAGKPALATAMHAAELEELARAMPANETKAHEYGQAQAVRPVQGNTIEAPSERTGASTLSEKNDTGKPGAPTLAPTSVDGRLERVRVNPADQVLTTNQAVAISDNQNSLRAGLRGPGLLEDFVLREKVMHFDHERIPERIVHARGSGAHGYFECYTPLTRYTIAAPFAEKGKITPVFVRFSTVAGERGSADTARDVRGFAIKFYTDQGNWDLVGNNIPVFFIQDAMKFPDLIHAAKPEPHHAMPQAATAHDTFWDFVSLMPESTHMLMWAMSDRGIPRSYRMMQGFGVHTFRLVNAKRESVFCKFHWRPLLGTHSLVWDEAVKIAGADPDFHRRDLWEAIESGSYPEWELGLQIFTEADAEKFSFDVLDATKLVPEELVPLTPVGRLVLNRNPDNFFAETEQVAFCTTHIIPGIDFSNDPLLAGRNFSYLDTQITRLGGANFHEIPINAPLASVYNNQRDGLHRQAIARGRVAYEPNSLGGGCPFQAGMKGFVSFPRSISANNAPVDRVRGKAEKFAEHYNQATLFYESQTPVEKLHIAGAFRFELSKVTVPAIRQRMLSGLRNVSEELAQQVADGLGMNLPKAMPRAIERVPKPEILESPPLSLTALPGEGGIRTRKVAILIADGVAGASIADINNKLAQAGAVARLVGTRLGTFRSAEGAEVEADASLENSPSVLFDGLVLPEGAAAAEALAQSGQALEFLKDQYRHCKTILVPPASAVLLEKAGISAAAGEEADGGLIHGAEAAKGATAFLKALARHRHFERFKDPPPI